MSASASAAGDTSGVGRFTTHVVDEGASVVKSLGGNVVTGSQSAEGAVKGAASSLSLPLTIGAVALGAFFLMKR